MIVKVQISQATSAPKAQVLVYNKERTLSYQGDATEEILDLMDGRPKAFFHAAILLNGKLDIRKEVAKKFSW